MLSPLPGLWVPQVQYPSISLRSHLQSPVAAQLAPSPWLAQMAQATLLPGLVIASRQGSAYHSGLMCWKPAPHQVVLVLGKPDLWRPGPTMSQRPGDSAKQTCRGFRGQHCVWPSSPVQDAPLGSYPPAGTLAHWAQLPKGLLGKRTCQPCPYACCFPCRGRDHSLQQAHLPLQKSGVQQLLYNR